MHSHICNKPAQRLMPDVSVCKYKGFGAAYNLRHAFLMINPLALTYRPSYDPFHDHLALTHVSIHNGPHTSAFAGEKLVR